MAWYIITYDLRKARNYDALYTQLSNWGAVSLLESVWLAELNGSASAVRDVMMQCLDGDDGVAVVQLQSGFSWGTKNVPKAASDWLKARSP